MTLRGTRDQVRRGCLRQRDRQLQRRIATILCRTAAPGATIALVGCRSKEAGQVRLDGEPRVEGIKRRIGRDFGGIDVQLLSPDQLRGQALLHDRFEEAAKDR
jgi:hypothetical protein